MAFGKVFRVTVGDLVEAIDFTGLYIEFKIRRSNKFTENKCELEIFNPSNDTIQQIQQIKTSTVKVEAGYQDEDSGTPGLIFSGNLISPAEVVWKGPDRILTLVAGPVRAKGYSENKESKKELKGKTLDYVFATETTQVLSDTYITMSYGPGAFLRDILAELAASLGVNTVGLNQLAGFTRPAGYVFGGRIVNCVKDLRILLFAEGYDFFLDLAELVVFNVRKSNTQFEAAYLSKDTGLLSVGPAKTYEWDPHQVEAFPPKTTWQLHSILNPYVRPNTLIQVDDPKLTGFVLTEQVEFQGTSQEGPYECYILVSQQ